MISLNKYLIFCLLLFSDISAAQEYLEDQFEYAKAFYEDEKYFDAVTEFKRLLFFDENNIYEYRANEFIALSYKGGGKFNEAVRFFTLAEIDAKNPEDIFRIKIEIIKTNILRRTTGNALKLIESLENDEEWKSKSAEINYWRGWAYIFADDWNKAAEEFSNISSDHELVTLCKDTHEKKYSVTFAKLASVILPGAGQFYTGNYLSGLISLGWCALWGYTAVNAFVEDRIFDGLVVTNFLWFRFYRGNLYNAEMFAVEENIRISNESLQYLQHNFSGIKP
jgi:hypothetical protein